MAAEAFWKAYGRAFVYKEDMWEQELRNFGFYLGKFILLLWIPIEEDLKTGSYNPLKAVKRTAKMTIMKIQYSRYW